MVRRYRYDKRNLILPQICAMHQDRKRVFIDSLKWDLEATGDQEFDEFDNEDAEYLVLVHQQTLDHLASMRLLPTTSPNLGSTIFPFLFEGCPPEDDDIYEITRFLLSPRIPARDRILSRAIISRALVEHAHEHGIRAYSAICEIGFLSDVLSAGWDCEPLGFPQVYRGETIGAFLIHIEPDTIDKMQGAWRHEAPAMEHLALATLAAS